MGRSKKTGLDYFPFDVDMFQDIKIRKLIKYQGGKAVAIYASLLCLIYKGGYYMRWDKELPFIISEMTGFEEAYISEVIKSCMVLGLFSKELFDSDGVLTSAGIQERYRSICRQLNRKCDFNEFSLISSGKNGFPPISSEENPISSEENPISSEKIPQKKIKGKEIKGKKEKSPNGDEKKTEQRFLPPSAEEVRAYVLEKGYQVDAEAFCAFYESKGWMVGKNRMKNWHAALVTWQKSREKEERNGKATGNGKSPKQLANEYAIRRCAERLERHGKGVPGEVPEPF